MWRVFIVGYQCVVVALGSGGGPPSEEIVCAPSEDMRGDFCGPGEFAEEG